MDRDDFELDLDLDLDDGGLDLPPVDEGEPTPRRPAVPPVETRGQGRFFVTFVVCLFGALELQTILVMLATADGGGAQTATMVFGLVFLVSVFAWFIGGMLWFAKRFDHH